jgi:hypothetical protein
VIEITECRVVARCSGPTHQLRELGDVGGDGPGLVAGEQMSRRATARAGEAMAMR